MYYLFSVLVWALRIYFYILIAYVLLSWFPEFKNTKIASIIARLADPYMRIFRGLLVFGAFDFTPILGFLLFQWGLNNLEKALELMTVSLKLVIG